MLPGGTKHNLNDTVVFKLKAGQAKPYDLYSEPDADGFYRTELWHFMQLFGGQMKMGIDTPVEMTVYIENY